MWKLFFSFKELSICETGNKCSNNGTCVVDSKDPSVYTCKCTDDFSGKNCDESKI